MATLGFPSNPSTGTVYTVGTRTWIWTGQGWKIDGGNTALNTLTAVSIVVTTSTNSVSTDSGAIKVVGGVGIGKDLTVGGSVFISQTSTIGGYEILTTATVNQYANQTSITAGTDTAVSGSTGDITIWNVSTLQSVTDRGTTTTNAILIDNAGISTSNNTGALVVTGGVGIGGNLYVGGEIVAEKLTIQLTTVTTTQVTTDDIISTYNITNATSTNSGALQVAGGAGIGKNVWIGGQLTANSIYVYSTNTESKIYGPVIIYNDSSSTSINDGALQVYGGVGIRGDLYVGNVISNGLKVLTSNDGNTGFVSSIIAGEDISVSSATGIVTVSDISTFQSVTNRGATTTNALTVLNYNPSTSTDTGALTIYGGLGVAENIFAGGSINALSLNVSTFSTITGNLSVGSVRINSTSDAYALDTGALQIAGGVSVAGNIYSAGNVYANGYLVNTGTFTGGILSAKTRITNSETSTSTDTGALQVVGGVGIGDNLYVGNSGSFDYITVRGITTSTVNGELDVGKLVVTGGDASTSTTTGALTVAGGVGIGGDVYIGASLNVAGDFTASNIYGVFLGTVSGTVDTANFAAAVTGGSAGTLLYQINSTQTGFVTTSLPGYVLVSNGTESPVYQNTLTLSSTTTSTDPFTGALTVAGGVGVGENLNVVGTIKGNNLQISGFDYVSTVSGYLDAGIVKVTAPLEFFNASSTDSGALQVIGGAGIGGTVYIGQDLHVAGTAFLNNAEVLTTQSGLSSLLGISVINQILKVTTSTNSTSTDSGAVVVTGGVGIGKDLYVGGDLTIKGSLVVTTASIGSSAVTSITAGTDTAVYGTVGNITIWNTSNLQSVTDRGNSTTNAIVLLNTDTSTSTDTGALTVAGGVGIVGDLYVGGAIYSSSSQVLTFANTSSLLVAYAEYATTSGYALSFDTSTVVANAISATTSNFATTAGFALSFDTSTVVTSAVNASSSTYADTAGVALSLGTGTFTIVNTTDSTGTNTGAFQVVGGVGIGGNLWVGGEIFAQKLTIEYTTITTTLVETDDIISTFNATSSTSTTTGALTVAGGVGIGGDVYIGGDLNVSGALVVTTASIGASAVTSITAGTDTAVSASLGAVIIWNTSTLQTITDRGNSTTNAVLVLNTSASTSTTTGALTVAGGVGIGGDVYIGGDLSVQGALVITTASISASAVTSIIAGTDTAVYGTVGSITIWNTGTLQTITDRGNSTTNAVLILNASTSTSTTTGALVVTGGAAIGEKLFVGSDANINGSLTLAPVVWSYLPTTFTNIPVTYGQTSLTFTIEVDDSITGMKVSQGAGGYGPGSVNLTILGTTFPGGTTPANDIVFNVQTFQSPGPVYSTDVTSAVSYVSGTLPPRYDSIKSTGNVGIGAENSHWTFGTDGNLTNPGAVSVLSTANSTSTTTGALTVAGGVGVELDMYVGGTIYSNNSQVVTFANTASLISSSAGFASTSGFALSFNTGTLVNVAVSASTSNFATTSGFALSFNTGTLVNIAIFASSSTYADVAGIANSLGTGTYTIVNSTVSIGTTTGALTVVGGVGIGGALYIGQPSYIDGAQILTTATLVSSGGITSITAGTDTSVYTLSGNVTIWNTSTLQTVTDRGNSTTNAILITNATAASSTNSGALQIVGGVGIGQDLYIGGSLYQNGQQVLTTASVNQFANQTSITAGTDTAVSTSTGAIIIWNTSTLQTVSDRGNSTTNAILITNATAAVSTNSGALQVVGGVGVGGNLYVGGEIVAQKLTIQLTTVTTTQVITDDIISTYNITNATSTNSGALQVAGGAGIGRNLYVGSTIYSSGNEVLTTATVNQFANQTSISAGVGISVNTSSGNVIVTNIGVTTATGSTYIGISTSSGNVIITNLGVTNLSSGTDITLSATTGSITINDVSTLQSVTGRGATTTNVVSFTNTTTSTSTATGAVVITGGLGVGGQINATSIVAGGVRTTTSSSAPANPTVGDMWYNTTNDRMYRYTANGVIDFWLDYTGPVVQYLNNF